MSPRDRHIFENNEEMNFESGENMKWKRGGPRLKKKERNGCKYSIISKYLVGSPTGLEPEMRRVEGVAAAADAEVFGAGVGAERRRRR